MEVIKDNRISENDETIVYYNEDYSIKKKRVTFRRGRG